MSAWRTVSMLLLVTLVASSAPTPAQADADRRQGRMPAKAALTDAAGAPQSLDSYDAEALVLVFVGVECPLVQTYVPTLNALAERYADRRVAFIAIDANAQDSLEELTAFAGRSGLQWPLWKDLGNQLADALGATRTPEAFVLDAQRRVRYAGRIDDRYGVGHERLAATRHDLAAALDELLAGSEIAQPATIPAGCLIGRVASPQAGATVTWSEQIEPIFQRRCQNCHRPGQIAPFALLDYDEVAGWGATIGEVVEQGRMPPWHAEAPEGAFADDGRLTAEERQLVLDWVAAGTPAGDVTRRPPPVSFTDGWLLSRAPDLVVLMTEQPYQVPASGVVEYQYFVADPRLTRDVWVDAAEVRPGNASVVHHVNVFVLPPELAGGSYSRDQLAEMWELQNHMLCGYVPGMRPAVFPSGLAKRVAAGSKFVFQVHYTPRGTAVDDCGQLGLVFAPEGAARKPVVTIPAMNNWFAIPPGEPDYRAELGYRLKEPSLLLAFLPHMHLRGRSFRYTAHYPDGRREVLLDVPRYDFMWQNRYVLATPRQLPADTRIECEAHFDNSADNLANPDPSVTVRWGEQSWEEMMIGYFDVVPLAEPTQPPPPKARWAVAGLLVTVGALGGWAWRRPRRHAQGLSVSPSPLSSDANPSTADHPPPASGP